MHTSLTFAKKKKKNYDSNDAYREIERHNGGYAREEKKGGSALTRATRGVSANFCMWEVYSREKNGKSTRN